MKVIRVFGVFIVKRRKGVVLGRKRKRGWKMKECVFSFSLSEIVSEKWGWKKWNGVGERNREMGFNGWANL